MRNLIAGRQLVDLPLAQMENFGEFPDCHR